MPYDGFDISGKVTLITGGTSGLGRAIALGFAQAGARVFAGSRDAGKIADTFNEIVAANQRMAQQLERVGEVVGRQGKTRQRVRFGISSGSWG